LIAALFLIFYLNFRPPPWPPDFIPKIHSKVHWQDRLFSFFYWPSVNWRLSPNPFSGISGVDTLSTPNLRDVDVYLRTCSGPFLKKNSFRVFSEIVSDDFRKKLWRKCLKSEKSKNRKMKIKNWELSKVFLHIHFTHNTLKHFPVCKKQDRSQ